MTTGAPRILLPLVLALGAPLLADDAQPATPLQAPASAPDADADGLKDQLAQTQEKLDIALRSYSQLQDQNAQLKADTDSTIEKLQAQVASLQEELAETQAKLDASEQGASDLRDENARLGGDVAPLQREVETLSRQVRQVQDELADLAAENARLKVRLALAAPAPGSPRP